MVRRVQTLFTVTNRQRHVDAGQAQGLHLGHGSRARTTHDEIRDSQRILHRRQVVDHVPAVRQSGVLDSCANRLVLATARQVYDLRAFRQRVRRTRHRLVDVQGSQGAARHQQRGRIRVDAEALRRLAARLGSALRIRAAVRKLSDRRTQRQARHDRVAVARLQRRGGERQSDDRRVACAHLIRQTGARVLLVNDDRDTRALRRNVRGRRHVAAKTDEHVSAFKRLRATLHGIRETTGESEERQGGTPRQRNAGNLHERESCGGNQIRLQTSLRPQDDNLSAALAQLRRRRQQRIHVTGSAAASHHNLDHMRLLYACA